MLSVFPRTWSLIHAFGHSLHLQNVAILLQKGKEMHVGGHTHMHTHSYTPDSVQLFNCLDPDVLHNYFHLCAFLLRSSISTSTMNNHTNTNAYAHSV